jgi:hypothetical protein
MRVVSVDVDAPLPDLVPDRPDGGRYEAAWVLATRGTRPLGHAVIPLGDAALPAEELARQLRAQLGDALENFVAPFAGVPDSALPFATVVVPTVFRRAEELSRCVDALVRLDYPAYEVIVVDNRPGDADVPAMPRLTDDRRVLVEREPRAGISAARNRGIAVARGEIIAFTDDDVEVDPGWLRALACRMLGEPDTDCVTGLILPRELETSAQVIFEGTGTFSQRYRPALYQTVAGQTRKLRPVHPSRFLVVDRLADKEAAESLYALGNFGGGANMAFRASFLKAIGGFDEALGTGTPTHGGEDSAAFVNVLFSGRSLAFEPTAFVRHTHRRTLDELRRQIHGYGVGFTAMLTALVWADRRHVVGLLRIVMPGIVALALRWVGRRKTIATPGYPEGLSRLELMGMVKGPLAYLRSRRGAWRQVR